MSKNRRGPQPLTGRARPIGPVLALARSSESVTEPLEFRTYYKVEYGETKVDAVRVSPSRNKFESNILALAAGSISVDNVDRNISLTPAQRTPLTYNPDGSISFPSRRQVLDPEQWESMEETDRLLVVSGILIKTASANGIPAQFNFQPQIWDIADPAQHTQGALAYSNEAELTAINA